MRLKRAAAAAVSAAAVLASGCGGAGEETQVEADPRFGEQPNFVFVIDWTATGAPPPMGTPPTWICRLEGMCGS